jgi:hypothetical protein
MALAVFCGMYLKRILVIGPLAFGIGFVLAVTQNFGDAVQSFSADAALLTQRI